MMVERCSTIFSKRSHQLVAGDMLGMMLFYSTLKFLETLFEEDIKIYDNIFNMLKNMPFLNQIISKEFEKFKTTFEHDIKSSSRELGPILTVLPEQGETREFILSFMEKQSNLEDKKCKPGHVSGAIYVNDMVCIVEAYDQCMIYFILHIFMKDHQKLLNSAFGMYSLANPLHIELWPSVMKYEAEIISMTSSLVKGNNPNVCGCTTSVT
jgi:hypothetical protein